MRLIPVAAAALLAAAPAFAQSAFEGVVTYRIERRALADDLFTVPVGFTEMRMPGMGPP